MQSKGKTEMSAKPRIAHLAGPNATIQNSPPLVTSNMARAKYNLPRLQGADGAAERFDVLRPQRLAAPVKVYVEQFTAHPLERDAAQLYAPPDGYLDQDGRFHRERQSPTDKPVYEITLAPEDGLYPMPYMARQADGSAWDEECAEPGAGPERARQGFYPDGSRTFEEINRFGIGESGRGNLISTRADIDFHRIIPPSGYTQGLPAAERTDIGEGDILPETRGTDFFPYKPYHIAAQPPRQGLARIVNKVQRVLASGDYLGGIWTQGSPRIEESIYWFNLLLDVTVPLCGNAAQRPHGQVSNDGPKNLVDSVDYITSRVWADEAGRNRAGMVLIQEQQIFAARDVQKGDARPGGYVATGGHGGIIGAAGHDGPPTLTYLPAKRHTYLSDVAVSRLPWTIMGVQRRNGRLVTTEVPIKSADDQLFESAIPKVMIVKDGSYTADGFDVDPEAEIDLIAQIDDRLAKAPLAGFVIEGYAPYGWMTSIARQRLMLRAIHCGMPVVRVGRGNNEGFTPALDRWIGGRNLTATKARILLIACLMKFGSLPTAADPDHPTTSEIAAVRDKVAAYQAVFDTH
jgi:L-asparaginase